LNHLFARQLPKQLTPPGQQHRRGEKKLDCIPHIDGCSDAPHVACLIWANSLTCRVPFASATGTKRLLDIDHILLMD
jgi:hypothetical protein